MIGVVAGVGPYAGLDLLKKITAQTAARSDQEHLTVVSISEPAAIPDRTAFLLGETAHNPALPILEQLQRLASLGAVVAGIPCNTAHAPPIMNVIESGLRNLDGNLRLLHMIGEVGRMLQQYYPAVRTVGVMATIGTIHTHVYPLTLEPLGYTVIEVSEPWLSSKLQPAIYDKHYGIKACGFATPQARANLLETIGFLQEQGAQAIILGCTELPLAFKDTAIDGLPLIDSTLALARALIAAASPQKLHPWQG